MDSNQMNNDPYNMINRHVVVMDNSNEGMNYEESYYIKYSSANGADRYAVSVPISSNSGVSDPSPPPAEQSFSQTTTAQFENLNLNNQQFVDNEDVHTPGSIIPHFSQLPVNQETENPSFSNNANYEYPLAGTSSSQPMLPDSTQDAHRTWIVPRELTMPMETKYVYPDLEHSYEVEPYLHLVNPDDVTSPSKSMKMMSDIKTEPSSSSLNVLNGFLAHSSRSDLSTNIVLSNHQVSSTQPRISQPNPSPEVVLNYQESSNFLMHASSTQAQMNIVNMPQQDYAAFFQSNPPISAPATSTLPAVVQRRSPCSKTEVRSTKRKARGRQAQGLRCAWCSLTFDAKGKLKKHLEQEHNANSTSANGIQFQQTCRIHDCTYTSFIRGDMDNHMKSHMDKGYSPTGRKRAPNKDPLQRHRYDKEESKCPQCDYTSVVEESFKHHISYHLSGDEEKLRNSKFSCFICGKDFPEKELKTEHEQRDHRGPMGHWLCDVCDFKTVQTKKVIQHRRMHTGERPHVCPICDYRAGRRDNLRSHIRRMHKKSNMYADSYAPQPQIVARLQMENERKRSNTASNPPAMTHQVPSNSYNVPMVGQQQIINGCIIGMPQYDREKDHNIT